MLLLAECITYIVNFVAKENIYSLGTVCQNRLKGVNLLIDKELLKNAAIVENEEMRAVK